MKIMVNENIPKMTVNELSKLGHNILDIRGTELEGIADEEIWKISQGQKRLLISTDKGFSKYRESPHYGIIMVCLKQPSRKGIHQRVLQAFSKYSPDEWRGLVVVVRDRLQSIWKYPSFDK